MVDVRLTPLSRKPGLSKTRLGAAAAERGIEYLHDRRLGNPKPNREPFWNGRSEAGGIVYRQHLDAAGGLPDLCSVVRTRPVIALLCFEAKHEHCHRLPLACALAEQVELALIHI